METHRIRVTYADNNVLSSIQGGDFSKRDGKIILFATTLGISETFFVSYL